MQQWLGAPPVPSPNVLIFVNPSGHAGRRLVAVELAVGEGAPRQTERDLVDRRPHEPQYYLRIAMERLVALSASNQRVYVVGFERGDVVAFRIPIDLGAISRGREALRLRVERTTEMAGRFASLCQRELPDPLSVIA